MMFTAVSPINITIPEKPYIKQGLPKHQIDRYNDLKNSTEISWSSLPKGEACVYFKVTNDNSSEIKTDNITFTMSVNNIAIQPEINYINEKNFDNIFNSSCKIR